MGVVGALLQRQGLAQALVAARRQPHIAIAGLVRIGEHRGAIDRQKLDGCDAIARQSGVRRQEAEVELAGGRLPAEVGVELAGAIRRIVPPAVFPEALDGCVEGGLAGRCAELDSGLGPSE